MYTFEYHRPTSLDEVAALLGSCEDPKILAGGMTLLPTMKQRLAQPSDLIDIGSVDDLAGLSLDGARIRVGALCRHVEVNRSSVVSGAIPALAALA
ncbi:MAG: carbon monoxide dehydrogenase, partial [Chromatiales bacterium]|nr:carbon monoxide dehydrogenase [Chromatiales bacterium]